MNIEGQWHKPTESTD